MYVAIRYHKSDTDFICIISILTFHFAHLFHLLQKKKKSKSLRLVHLQCRVFALPVYILKLKLKVMCFKPRRNRITAQQNREQIGVMLRICNSFALISF